MQKFKIYQMPTTQFIKLYAETFNMEVKVLKTEQQKKYQDFEYPVLRYYFVNEELSEQIEELLNQTNVEASHNFYDITRDPIAALRVLNDYSFCKIESDPETSEQFSFQHSIFYNHEFFNDSYQIFVQRLLYEGEANDINLNQLRAIYKEQYPKTLKLDAQRRKIWKK